MVTRRVGSSPGMILIHTSLTTDNGKLLVQLSILCKTAEVGIRDCLQGFSSLLKGYLRRIYRHDDTCLGWLTLVLAYVPLILLNVNISATTL